MSDFKIGDIVTGIDVYYGITNKHATLEVMGIDYDGKLTLKVLSQTSHPTCVGETYSRLDPERFVKVNLAPETEVEVEVEEAPDDLLDGWVYKLSNYLDHLDYEPANSNVLREILSKTWKAKGAIRNILRKHPNWDEKQQAVVFTSHIACGINYDEIRNFSTWVLDNMDRTPERRFTELDNICSRMKKLQDYLDTEVERTGFNEVRVNYFSLDQIREMREVAYRERDELYKVRDFIYNWDRFISDSKATEEFVAETNKVFPNVKAAVGQKVSRIINKICHELKVDGIKKIERKYNGEEKDFGYNYKFARFADSINPVEVTKYTVVSINPIDYLRSSIGTNWASCHTIDIFGVDQDADDEHHYHGMYSAGTMSYMLDESTVVMYTVDKDYEGEMCWAKKDRRILFHMAGDGDEFVYGRLYPDGRDGGELGMASQLRQIFQQVISTALDRPNLWVSRKGTSGNYEMIAANNGVNYNDYYNYDDTGICWRKGTDIRKIIKIGKLPICPSCGKEHDRAANIYCHSCMSADGENPDREPEYDHYCARCGDGIDEGDEEAVYCEDNGNWYCCSDCAERDDVVFCHNNDEYHLTENCFVDHYLDEWVYGEPEVRAVDGNLYLTESNAEDDGCRWCERENEWYYVDNCRQDDWTDEYFIPDEDSVSFCHNGIMFNFMDEQNANECGFYKNDDGEWTESTEGDE